MDSGPVQYDSQVGLVAGLVFGFIVVLPSVLVLFYCYKIKSSFYHQWRSKREKDKNKTKASDDKGANGHLNPAFHLKVVGQSSKATREKVPHTNREVLPLKPSPVQNGSQLVNVVRPLRPVPTPPGAAQRLKAVHQAVPTSNHLTPKTKLPQSPQRLSPPQKPLPLNPVRPSLLVAGLQSKSSPFPPQRPLPLSPARGQPVTVSTRTTVSKPSTGLLVMMPPAVGPKPQGKISAIPPLRVVRPVPGVKPNTASSRAQK